MEESDRLAFNGSHWLFTLGYGVQKQQEYQNLERKLRGKNVLDILATSDEVERRAAKLMRAKAELDALLHTEVVITPISEENPDPISGSIEKIDLKRGDIGLLSNGEVTTVTFCDIADTSATGVVVTPTVTMHAEKEYKF